MQETRDRRQHEFLMLRLSIVRWDIVCRYNFHVLSSIQCSRSFSVQLFLSIAGFSYGRLMACVVG